MPIKPPKVSLMDSQQFLQLFSTSVAIGLCSSFIFTPQAVNAQQKSRSQNNFVLRIDSRLRKEKQAIRLDRSSLSSYSAFRSRLRGTIKKIYSPLVVKVDNGLIDGILKPIYNNLLSTRFKNDKSVQRLVKISSSNFNILFSRSGEITFSDSINYKPVGIARCGSRNSSTLIPCYKTKKQLSKAEAAFRKNPDKNLLKNLSSFRQVFAKTGGKGTLLQGKDISKLGPLELSSILFASSPGSQTRAGNFFPPAFLAYKKIAPGGPRKPSGLNTTPNPTLPQSDPGGTLNPGRLRSEASGIDNYFNNNANISNYGDIASVSLRNFVFPQGIESSGLKNNLDLDQGLKNTAYRVTNNGRNTNYQLINGFTFDRQTRIGQSWRTTVNYLIKKVRYRYGWTFDYSYLFGVRAAFDVNTVATGSRNGSMTVRMTAGDQGANVFTGAFPPNRRGLVYGGRELLAEVCHKGCRLSLWGDVPGPDPLPITKNFNRKNFLTYLPQRFGNIRNGQLSWPNVGGRTRLGKMKSDIDLFAGQVRGCVLGVCAGAVANPYVKLDMRGLRYRQKWTKNNGNYRFSGLNSVSSQNSNINFNYTNLPRINGPLATGVNNQYTFDFQLVPGVSFDIDLIVTDLGPYDLDLPGLAIDSPNYNLWRHSGSWNGAWTSVPN